MAVLKYRTPDNKWEILNTNGGKDCVQSFSTENDFPEVGEMNILYVDLSNGSMFIWNKDKYVKATATEDWDSWDDIH